MKHIVKRQEPPSFTNWKAQETNNWHPIYADLRGDIKDDVHNNLITEQGHICCYCEKRIKRKDSHIEHFRPQSVYPGMNLDYCNMLCSCMRETMKGEPLHCGNKKEDWFDETLIISPLDQTCESRFAFMGDGRIKPASSTDDAARETINRLGLNIPKLIALRAHVITHFLDEELTEDERNQFAAAYLEKDEKGMFGEFWTTIKYLFI